MMFTWINVHVKYFTQVYTSTINSYMGVRKCDSDMLERILAELTLLYKVCSLRGVKGGVGVLPSYGTCYSFEISPKCIPNTAETFVHLKSLSQSFCFFKCICTIFAQLTPKRRASSHCPTQMIHTDF